MYSIEYSHSPSHSLFQLINDATALMLVNPNPGPSFQESKKNYQLTSIGIGVLL